MWSIILPCLSSSTSIFQGSVHPLGHKAFARHYQDEGVSPSEGTWRSPRFLDLCSCCLRGAELLSTPTFLCSPRSLRLSGTAILLTLPHCFYQVPERIAVASWPGGEASSGGHGGHKSSCSSPMLAGEGGGGDWAAAYLLICWTCFPIFVVAMSFIYPPISLK